MHTQAPPMYPRRECSHAIFSMADHNLALKRTITDLSYGTGQVRQIVSFLVRKFLGPTVGPGQGVKS